MRRGIRNSHRIARRAGQKRARPLVSGQAKDEKLTLIYSLNLLPLELICQYYRTMHRKVKLKTSPRKSKELK